jgi:tyrosine-protein phosphatase SIW14
MRKVLLKQFSILMILLSVAALSVAAQQTRPAKWAAPVSSGVVKNFYRLDARVYRSAQPDEKGFLELERLGIRSVLNLRDHHSDNGDAKGTALKLYRVEMDAGGITDANVIEALRIIKNADAPILIHCWHGSDRTGLISAMYRIVFQGWSKDDAIDELTHGGYGYHSMYKNLPEYIRKADLEALKKKVLAL